MMDSFNNHLATVQSQVSASLDILRSTPVLTMGIGRSRPALADPYLLEVVSGLHWYLQAPSAQVSDVTKFLGYAESRLEAIQRDLASWGITSTGLLREVTSLQIADHLLRPAEGRGIRINASSRKALPMLEKQLYEASAIQDRLASIVSMYRFAVGDYSYSDPAERRFTQVVRHILPFVRCYYQDLLIVDRDRIEEIVRQRTADVLLIGAKQNGCGTWSSTRKDGEGRAHSLPADCVQIVEVTRMGVRVAKRARISHSALPQNMLPGIAA